MNNKGYTVKELLVVLVVFTIVYFAGVIAVSHSFNYDQDNEAYLAKIELMKTQAEKYAEEHNDDFGDDNKLVIYANDLVKDNYLASNENGNIEDPRDSSKTLNDVKIEIIKQDEGYVVNIPV